MASLRSLERDGELQLIDRDSLPWELLRNNVYYSLLRKGFQPDQAEDFASEAMVRTLEEVPDVGISMERCRACLRSNTNAAIGDWIATRAVAGDPLPDNLQADRRIELRTSAQPTTSVRDAIRANREYKRLLQVAEILILSDSLPDKAGEHQYNRLAGRFCALPTDCKGERVFPDAIETDTTQLPPARTVTSAYGDDRGRRVVTRVA